MGTNRKLKTDGNLEIESSQVDINSDIDVTGDVGSTTLTTSGNATVGGDIDVTGDVGGATATITGDASVGGNASVTGNVSCVDVDATGDLGGATSTITGNATVGGTLGVTGQSTLSGLAYPTSDGTNGQALVTNGSGVLSFADVASGGVDTITSASDATNYSGTASIIYITSTAGVTFTTNLSNRIVICENDILVTLANTGSTLWTVENLHFKSIGDFKFAAHHASLKNSSIKCKDVDIENYAAGIGLDVGISNSEIFCNDITWTNVNGDNTYSLYDSNVYCQLFYPPTSGGGGNTDLIDIRNCQVNADIFSGYIDLDSTYPSFLNSRKGTDGTGWIYIDSTSYVNPNYNYPFKVDQNGVDTNVIMRAELSGSQSVSSTNPVKAEFDTETYDITSAYDNATNYRFTSKVKGYYKVTTYAQLFSVSSITNAFLEIYKNGSQFFSSPFGSVLDATSRTLTVSDTVELDINDYIEIYVSCSDTSYSIYKGNLSIEKIN